MVGFDEQTKHAMELLFEYFWIVRADNPDQYWLIKNKENKLREYLLEKFEFNLIVNKYFIKLEKVPVDTEVWMGIQSFKSNKDYAILCSLMAYLSNKNVNEQFLLSEACESIKRLYPIEEGIDWENYGHRQSLVRVMKLLQNLSVVKAFDGDISGFHQEKDQEVLYQVTVLSRYFLRSFLGDLENFKDVKEFLGDQKVNIHRLKRSQKVYTRLFLSPVVHKHEIAAEEYEYLKNYRNYIEQDVRNHSDFQFELYKNEAFLSTNEAKAIRTLSNNGKMIADIALQFAKAVKDKIEDRQLKFDSVKGSLELTAVEFENIILECKGRDGWAWSKEYRQASLRKLAGDLLDYLAAWKLAGQESETSIIFLYPPLVRTVGDLLNKQERKDDGHEQA